MSQFKFYFPVSEVVHAISKVAASTNLSSKTPSEEYYYYNVLEMSEGMEEMGGVNWKLCSCLLFSWIIVLVCLIRGISSLGKVRIPMFLHGVIAASPQVLPGKVGAPVLFCTIDTNAAPAVLEPGYCRREFYNRYLH